MSRECEHATDAEMSHGVFIVYKGGGYDGCFWEWNACAIDDAGEFHDLYSSGRDGCESEDAMSVWMSMTMNQGAYENYQQYRIDCETCWAEFIEEFANPVVLKTIETLLSAGFVAIQDHEVGCSSCGHKARAVSIYRDENPWSDDLRYDEDHDEFICGRCWDAGHCDVCDSFSHGLHYICPHPHVQSIAPGFSGQVCEYCVETLGDALGIPQGDEWGDMVTQFQAGYAWMTMNPGAMSVRVEKMRSWVEHEFTGIWSHTYAWQFILGCAKKLVEDGMPDGTWRAVVKPYHPKAAILEELGYAVSECGNVTHNPTTPPQSRAAAFYDAIRSAHPAVAVAELRDRTGSHHSVQSLASTAQDEGFHGTPMTTGLDTPSFIRGEDDADYNPRGFKGAATLSLNAEDVRRREDS